MYKCLSKFLQRRDVMGVPKILNRTPFPRKISRSNLLIYEEEKKLQVLIKQFNELDKKNISNSYDHKPLITELFKVIIFLEDKLKRVYSKQFKNILKKRLNSYFAVLKEAAFLFGYNNLIVNGRHIHNNKFKRKDKK